MIEVTRQAPSLGRYRSCFWRHYGTSVLRCLEYERLAALGLAGTVLDFGGGARANYASRVAEWGQSKGSFDYQSANIDPATAPTFLLGPGDPLPAEDGSYDVVLSFNTLEHVFTLDNALAELSRVLKPGGRLVVIVPFVFRVHGHPDDYHRGTPSFWQRKLSVAGFSGIAVEALVWGPFSTAQSVSGLPGPLKGLRRHFALLLDILYGRRHFRGRDMVVVPQDSPLVAAALGYFIEASKQ